MGAIGRASSFALICRALGAPGVGISESTRAVHAPVALDPDGRDALVPRSATLET